MAATVRLWSGREAKALRRALRLTVQDFAEFLGVSVRTVAKWESRGPDIQPKADSQAILDTALAQGSPEVVARFMAEIGMSTTSVDDPVMTADSSERVTAFSTRGLITRPKWNETISVASEHLWLYGMAELGFALDDNVPGILKEATERGCDIRVLLLDPAYPGITAIDADEDNPAGTLRSRIFAALTRFQRLSEECRPAMKIRVYNAQPTVSIVRGDDRMLVTPYLRFFVGSNSPSLELHRSTAAMMFDRYTRHFEGTWGRAKEWVDDG